MTTLWNRWLGIGLATAIAVVTLALALTGRLALYISPDTVWFAAGGAVVTLLAAVLTCLVPLGGDGDHGHDHAEEFRSRSRQIIAQFGAVAAGAAASVVVVAALILPPASLSVDLALSRATGNTTLFAGTDSVALGVADTTTFGIGAWASVFATATHPETYDGAEVTLTGFVTPSGDDPDEVQLTRMVITHCVIDALPAGVPVGIPEWSTNYQVGQWVSVVGTVKADPSGTLSVVPTSVEQIDEPVDPYEF